MDLDLMKLPEEERVSIITELLDLYEAKGGLSAEDVVEFAKDPKTALHKHFEWDDAEAARQWRLQKARSIIRVSIQFSADNAPKTFRPLINLVKDPTIPGGGYRNATEVYNANEEARRRLVKDAIREMQRLKLRYAAVAELAPVFAALESVEVPAPPVAERVSQAA